MNENNVNSNIENEKTDNPVYGSKFLMNKELYYDFASVSYNRTKKVFLPFLCLFTFIIGINLLIGNYDVVLWFAPFMSFLMILIYFKTKNAIKIGYERMVISEGKEIALNYELFEDKVVSHNDELKREYSYHQITKFFETERFLLLHLQHNLYLTIEKSKINTSVDQVKSFLMGKCTLVKKKKFIDCSNDKKLSLAFLIALIAVAFIGTVIGLVLKFI